MTDSNKKIKHQESIHIRIKPNGSLSGMITLDPETLLELDVVDSSKKQTAESLLDKSSNKVPKI